MSVNMYSQTDIKQASRNVLKDKIIKTDENESNLLLITFIKTVTHLQDVLQFHSFFVSLL